MLENLLKASKEKFLFFTFLANIFYVSSFGNISETINNNLNKQKNEDEIKIEKIHINEGLDYLNKANGKVSSSERLLLLTKARNCFFKAYERYNDCEALRNIGKVDIKLIEYQRAIENLELSLKCEKDDKIREEIMLDLSLAYREIGNYKKAEEFVNKVIQKNKGNAEAYNCLGILFFRKNEFEKAIEKFKESIKLNPDNAYYYANLADAYANKNDLKNAISSIEKALSIMPNNPTLNWIAANIYLKNKDIDKATSLMEKILDLNPWADNIREKLNNMKKEYNIK